MRQVNDDPPVRKRKRCRIVVDSDSEDTTDLTQDKHVPMHDAEGEESSSGGLAIRSTGSDMQILIGLLENGKVYVKDRSSSVLIKKLQHIDEMIGLRKLKTFVTEVFYYHAAKVPCDSMFPNICITGVPGSGKTEVCLRIASLLQYILFGSTCSVPVLGRADLVGRVLGETAIKTKQCLSKHRRKCIFIDEVYSLGSGSSDHDSFSKEAIDTICGYLSENMSTCAMVIAGYKNETNECFFSMNPGLERRFPWRFTLERYGPSELLDIFLYKLPRFKVENIVVVRSLFEKKRDYGAADVVTFINKLLLVHCKSVCIDKCAKKHISTKSINKAISQMTIEVVRPDNHMYL